MKQRRILRTNYRILRTFLDGCNVDHVIAPLLTGRPDGEVRAIVRAARVCPIVTPLAYYDAW